MGFHWDLMRGCFTQDNSQLIINKHLNLFHGAVSYSIVQYAHSESTLAYFSDCYFYGACIPHFCRRHPLLPMLIIVVFGGFMVLTLSGMSLADSVMANSSAISHFGLFAAIQGGIFGAHASGMIAFVFAMPFLVHPFLFWIFGKMRKKRPHAG